MNQFKFDNHDDNWVKFKHLLYEISQSALIAIQEKNELKNIIENKQNEIKKIMAKIEFHELHSQTSQNTLGKQDNQLERLRVLQEENSKQIEMCQMKISKCDVENKTLQEEFRLLNTDELVLYWESKVHEPRPWWAILGWTVKTFSYSDLPFSTVETNVKTHCENGKFDDPAESKPADGKFQVTYKSDFWKDGIAEVKILLEKRNHPAYKKRMESITNLIQKNTYEKAILLKEMEELQQGISQNNYVEQDSTDQKKIEVLENEIRQKKLALIKVDEYISKHFHEFEMAEQISTRLQSEVESPLLKDFIQQFSLLKNSIKMDTNKNQSNTSLVIKNGVFQEKSTSNQNHPATDSSSHNFTSPTKA